MLLYCEGLYFSDCAYYIYYEIKYIYLTSKCVLMALDGNFVTHRMSPKCDKSALEYRIMLYSTEKCKMVQ